MEVRSSATIEDGAAGVDIVLDDDAGSPLPDGGPLASDTYQPAQYGGPVTQMASPAPALPYGVALSEFAGEDSNGAWALYVFDDLELNSGTFAGGWSLVIT